MTKKTKLLERVRNNPKDVKFSEVQNLLKDVGFKERHPTPIHDVNLKAMQTIAKAFDVRVGYSDHTLGIEVTRSGNDFNQSQKDADARRHEY